MPEDTAEEIGRAKARARSQRNREARTPEKRAEIAAYMREWRLKNPGRIATYGVGDAARNRAYRARQIGADPEAFRARQRAGQLMTKFRLTPEQYEERAAAQDHRCAICRQPETATQRGRLIPLSVDHDRACCPGDRSCGRCIRALLCVRCNVVLGAARDSAALLGSAIAYLDSWRSIAAA